MQPSRVPQGQQPEQALQQNCWKTSKGAFWRCFLPVVLIASIDFPLYLSNRLRVEYLLFPSFPLVICPKRSDIAMKCHLVRKFLCAAPDLPLNGREQENPIKWIVQPCTRKHRMHTTARTEHTSEHTHQVLTPSSLVTRSFWALFTNWIKRTAGIHFSLHLFSATPVLKEVRFFKYENTREREVNKSLL